MHCTRQDLCEGNHLLTHTMRHKYQICFVNDALWTRPYLVSQTQDPPQLLTLSPVSVPSSEKAGWINCSILHTASKPSACVPQLLFQVVEPLPLPLFCHGPVPAPTHGP